MLANAVVSSSPFEETEGKLEFHLLFHSHFPIFSLSAETELQYCCFIFTKLYRFNIGKFISLQRVWLLCCWCFLNTHFLHVLCYRTHFHVFCMGVCVYDKNRKCSSKTHDHRVNILYSNISRVVLFESSRWKYYFGKRDMIFILFII